MSFLLSSKPAKVSVNKAIKKSPPLRGRRCSRVTTSIYCFLTKTASAGTCTYLSAITGGTCRSLSVKKTTSVRLSGAMFPYSTDAPLSAAGDSL